MVTPQQVFRIDLKEGEVLKVKTTIFFLCVVLFRKGSVLKA